MMMRGSPWRKHAACADALQREADGACALFERGLAPRTLYDVEDAIVISEASGATVEDASAGRISYALDTTRCALAEAAKLLGRIHGVDEAWFEPHRQRLVDSVPRGGLSAASVGSRVWSTPHRTFLRACEASSPDAFRAIAALDIRRHVR
eukprot:SAG11_NODE_2589_length_3188_cov_2.228155_2_plen_151_part_00